MFTGLVGVDDTSNAIFAVNAVSAIDAFCNIIVTVLDGDIDSVGAIRAVGAGRTCQANMADAVFTGNGNCIFSVLAGDTDFTVDTILTGFSLWSNNRDSILAFVTNHDIIAQFQVICDLASRSICRFMKQDVLASIDILFCLFVLGTSWCITFYSQCRMGTCRCANRL